VKVPDKVGRLFDGIVYANELYDNDGTSAVAVGARAVAHVIRIRDDGTSCYVRVCYISRVHLCVCVHL
jgi:hypothetical protein